MNRAYGVVPRNNIEEAAGPALKGLTFAEANEIFLRLLRGDTLNSDDITAPTLTRADFRNDEAWQKLLHINLNAPMLLCRHFCRGMIQRRRGHVLNVSSMEGWVGSHGLAAYSAKEVKLT